MSSVASASSDRFSLGVPVVVRGVKRFLLEEGGVMGEEALAAIQEARGGDLEASSSLNGSALRERGEVAASTRLRSGEGVAFARCVRCGMGEAKARVLASMGKVYVGLGAVGLGGSA